MAVSNAAASTSAPSVTFHGGQGTFQELDLLATVDEPLVSSNAQDSTLPIEDFLQEFLPTAHVNAPSFPTLDFGGIVLPCDVDPSSTASFYNIEETTSALRDVINQTCIFPHFLFTYTDGCVLAAVPYTLIQGLHVPRGTVTIDPRQIISNLRLTIELVDESGYMHGRAGMNQIPGTIYEGGHTPGILRDTLPLQNRTHVYAVKLIGSRARLFRFDCVGVVASELFDWRANHGRYLADFLRRLGSANAREEGLDDSGGALAGLSAGVLAEARASIKEFTHGLHDFQDSFPLYLMKCWDDSISDLQGTPRSRILLATPYNEVYGNTAEPLIRDYIGYDPETCCSYHVKDAWTIHDTEEPRHYALEGHTYARLKAAGVRHIPEVECAGFVRWQDGSVQASRSQDFCPHSTPLWSRYRRVHYRILFKDIGRPLATFRSTYELVQAVGQAIVAHGDAYVKANILHNDVSSDNIRIDRTGKAFLCGWNTATAAPTVDELGTKSAKDWRGVSSARSWRVFPGGDVFKPGTLRRSADPMPCVYDDLESFFWVLLILVFRYRYAPVRWTVPSEAPSFKIYLDNLFDFRDDPFAVDIFDIPKLTFLHPRYPHPSDKELQSMVDHRNGLKVPQPLAELLCCLRRDFSKVHYGTNLNPTNDVDLCPPFDARAPGAHEGIINRFVFATMCLDWYFDDSAHDRFATPLDIETWQHHGDFDALGDLDALSQLHSFETPFAPCSSPSNTPSAPGSPFAASLTRECAERVIYDFQRVWRNPDGSPIPSGFLAHILLHPSGKLATEIKIGAGRLTIAQRQMLKEYAERYRVPSGTQTSVVRPPNDDLPSHV